MGARDPNIERIELVALALGPLRDDLVFVGGCADLPMGLPRHCSGSHAN